MFCETTVTFVTNTVATISQVHFVKAPQGTVFEKLERKDFDYLFRISKMCKGDGLFIGDCLPSCWFIKRSLQSPYF